MYQLRSKSFSTFFQDVLKAPQKHRTHSLQQSNRGSRCSKSEKSCLHAELFIPNLCSLNHSNFLTALPIRVLWTLFNCLCVICECLSPLYASLVRTFILQCYRPANITALICVISPGLSCLAFLSKLSIFPRVRKRKVCTYWNTEKKTDVISALVCELGKGSERYLIKREMVGSL